MSKGWKYGIGLGVVILLLFAGNLLVGSVSIPPADVFRILLGGEGGEGKLELHPLGNPVCPKR